MGQKDLSEKNLEYFPDVFADIINALLYQGERIVDERNLHPAPTETLYYSQKGHLRNQFHDVSKYEMTDNTIQLQYTLENETKINRRMLLRRIGYEGAVYREQLDAQRTHPFIGLILYWGRSKWHGAQSIAEFFANRSLPLDTWKYINNFRMQVFQMAHLPEQIRAHFTSDMRIVVDYLAEGKDYIPTRQPIIHLEAFLLLMKNLSGDNRYEEIIPQLLERQTKGESTTMCELLDKYFNKGLELGIPQGISQGLPRGESSMLVKNVNALIANLSFTLQQACESLGSSVEEYQKAKALIEQPPFST